MFESYIFARMKLTDIKYQRKSLQPCVKGMLPITADMLFSKKFIGKKQPLNTYCIKFVMS